jgi:hypothetical protein
MAPTPEGSRKSTQQRVSDTPELRPFKIVGHLVGALYDEDGDIVGEQVMGEVAIYRKSFDKVSELVDDAWKRSQEMERTAEEPRGATNGSTE